MFLLFIFSNQLESHRRHYEITVVVMLLARGGTTHYPLACATKKELKLHIKGSQNVARNSYEVANRK